MSRSILSSLSFVFFAGLCTLGLYIIQTANFCHPMNLEADVVALNTSAIKLGSPVTLRLVGPEISYLRSHAAFYPLGSQQQQVSLAPHRREATT